MKKIQIILIGMLSLLAISCTTSTTDRSYEMAKNHQFDMTLNYIASKEALKTAMVKALTLKKWNLKEEGNAIRAQIDHGGVSGRLFITFEDNAININSRGSNIGGEPIVPLRLINNLNGVIRQQMVK